jgi:hypothetical protein
MMHHSYLKDPTLSFNHIAVLEKKPTWIIPLAITLLLLQKHQNNSFSDIKTLKIFMIVEFAYDSMKIKSRDAKCENPHPQKLLFTI